MLGKLRKLIRRNRELNLNTFKVEGKSLCSFAMLIWHKFWHSMCRPFTPFKFNWELRWGKRAKIAQWRLHCKRISPFGVSPFRVFALILRRWSFTKPKKAKSNLNFCFYFCLSCSSFFFSREYPRVATVICELEYIELLYALSSYTITGYVPCIRSMCTFVTLHKRQTNFT